MIRLAVIGSHPRQSPKAFNSAYLVSGHVVHFFPALSGQHQQSYDRAEAWVRLRRVNLDATQFLILQPTVARLNSRRRFHAFHRTTLDVASADRPPEETAHHPEGVPLAPDLPVGHPVGDSDNIDTGDLGQGLVAQDWFDMVSQALLSQPLPARSLAGFRELISKVGEGQIDGLTLLLPGRFARIDALDN